VNGTQRPSVVIADDEVHIVDVLALLFEYYDVEIIKTYNGEQALQAVHEHAPALVIADIMMPKMNGAELCRRVKNDPTTANTTVILMSALPQHALPSVPADGYLPKPFELSRVEAFAAQHFVQR
jgi:two-component system, OmpR family, alkaline phosphatase synthesis response regulator PhoP